MAIINSYPTVTPSNSDLLLLVDTSVEGNPTKTATVSSVAGLVQKGYKDYVFSFTQSGTNNPVVTELNNDTGLTFTFNRQSPGVFFLAPSSPFEVNKVWLQITGGHIGNETVLNVKGYSANKFEIDNIDFGVGPVDDVDVGFVELRIYS